MKSKGIIEEMGLTGPYDHEEYVSVMLERFGQVGLKMMTTGDRLLTDECKEKLTPQLYRAQNKNVDMSHYVSAHCLSEIYLLMLEWLERYIPKSPCRVLEVGCGNGLFTIAMAKLWPDSTIVGVDTIRQGLDVANKLRIKFSAHNTSFGKMDITGSHSTKKLGVYNLIVAPFVLHEISPLEDTFPKTMSVNLSDLLVPGGLFVSINRFPFPDEGKQKLQKSLGEEFIEEHNDTITTENESFPVFIYRRV